MVRRIGAGARARLRSIPDPTLAGGIALTFLVIAFLFSILLRNNQVLFVVCVVWVTVLASGLVTLLAIPRLSVERRVPARVHAGAPFDVRLRITNRSRWRPAFDVAFLDALQISETRATTRGPATPVLPPGGVLEVAYRKRIHRRGVYTVANTLAATRFPFAVFERRVLLHNPARLVVLPAVGRLRRAARRELSSRTSAPLARRIAREGYEEFERLREFRPGDNPRHIHWRTSARVGSLVRMIFEQEAAQDLVIFLDTHVGEGIEAERRRRGLEIAISCAATLLADAAERGRRASVHFDGGQAGHAGTRAGLVPALEALAPLRPGAATVDQVVSGTIVRKTAAALLLSLAGPATAARRAASRMGLGLRVWDVADPAFERYFARR
jgi:uncharacterized protein (DUF58 family)